MGHDLYNMADASGRTATHGAGTGSLVPDAGAGAGPVWSSSVEPTRAVAASLKASCSRCVAVVGGGLSGLGAAAAFATRGYGVCIMDASGEPGSAPASSAAAGLLDPLTPKGKLMWRGVEAFQASSQLLSQAAAQHPGMPAPARSVGVLHVPASQKHAATMREAAFQPHLRRHRCTSICANPAYSQYFFFF